MNSDILHAGFVTVTLKDKFWNIKKQFTQKNTITQKWEDSLAKFMTHHFSAKYDATTWSTQSWYFDFCSIGCWFKTDATTTWTTTVIVLPYKPIWVVDWDTDAYDWKTVTIHSWALSWLQRVVATNWYNPANTGYANKPTITVTVAFSWVVWTWIQLWIEASISENWLQWEWVTDWNWVYLNPASQHRLFATRDASPVLNETSSIPLWSSLVFWWGSSMKITEVWRFNNATNWVWGAKSWDMFGRVDFGLNSFSMTLDDIALVQWTMRIWTAR